MPLTNFIKSYQEEISLHNDMVPPHVHIYPIFILYYAVSVSMTSGIWATQISVGSPLLLLLGTRRSESHVDE